MRFFDFQMDEQDFREFLRNVVDLYEASLHDFGTYQAALENTQAQVIEKATKDLQEEMVEEMSTIEKDDATTIH